ncbi:MAG: hypothetical protein HKN11_18140 [Rhizobiales bacterium]|nr:hypothetical protein [Hyphomicrobiales bacterium]
MLETFFHEGSVRPGFDKEFVSIFDGWLGQENLHRLDEVTDDQFQRINEFMRLVHQHHRLMLADIDANTLLQIEDIDAILQSHAESRDKQSSQFTKVVIPGLEAVFTEEWDYTWIVWHKNNGAVEALDPLITNAGLFHWNDAAGVT